MSTGSTNDNANNPNPPAGAEGKDEFVARSAYEEVSRDMHKYKTSNKELTARLNELETRVKTAEETKLQEEKRFEELYQKERETRETRDL